jgi:hypothetical protein
MVASSEEILRPGTSSDFPGMDEILGNRGDALDPLLSPRMRKAKCVGVERMSANPWAGMTVGEIAEDWGTKVFEVDSNLMGPASEGMGLDQADLTSAGSEQETGFRIAGGQAADVHAGSFERMSADRGDQATFARSPYRQGEVALGDPTIPKRFCQGSMRRFVASHQEDTAGLLVQPMNDACPPRLLPSSVHPAPKDSVDQGALADPRSGMGDHPSWLIDHQEIVILVEHLEVDRLGDDCLG